MSHFKVDWEVFPLKLKEVFTISRGSKSQVPNVFLSITKDGFTGYGEAGPNTRYNETPEKVKEYFDSLPDDFFDEIEHAEEITEKLEGLNLSSIQSAKCAIENGMAGLVGQIPGSTIVEVMGYRFSNRPVTSYTIGLDKPERMQKKIQEAGQYPVYKIKLGTDRDREIIQAIREVTDKPLRVDANEGWTNLDQAKREIEFLATQNVELIEQPMPADEFELMKKLKQWSPLPLAADESFRGNEDLREIAEAFHVINIKLMKIGSLVKARQVLKEARSLGMEVMIGCMIESSLANAAGTLLALEADYADLDGHLLIGNDPFSGLTVLESREIELSEKPGFGVSK